MTTGAHNTVSLRDAYASPWGSPLLEDISLDISAGDIVAIAGPNGAGKSSLLSLIAGDIALDQGSATFNGEALTREHAQNRAKKLAFLQQLSLLNFPYLVEEVVALGRIPHQSGKAVDQKHINAAFTSTDMFHLRHRPYTELSGGEKQRTQLARVFAQLAGEPDLTGKLLLLDEPTSALDLSHQQQILVAINDLAKRGCAIVIVIHDLNLASSVSNHLLE